MSEISLLAELARMTAYFQLRTIATVMGADPNAVDAQNLTLRITNSPAASPLTVGDPGLAPVAHSASPDGEG